MPKRKRKDDQKITTSPHSPVSHSELMSCSSRMASLTKEKRSSRKVDNNTVKSLASIIDISDCPEKQSGSHQSDQNLNHTILLRHPRYYMGRQYARRNSSKTAGTSSSHGKVTPSPTVDTRFHDFNKSAVKDDGLHTGNGVDHEKEFCRAKRPRSSSNATTSSSSRDAAKMVCGICDRLLKRKPYTTLDTAISLGDISVVAVLVCGHVYHADCLEQGTPEENRHDPPCPMCIGLLQQAANESLD